MHNMIGMTTLIALTTRSQHVQSLALITHHITDKAVYLNEATGDTYNFLPYL